MSEGQTERVQKALARAGVGSRRGCEDLIRAGRVRINGRVAKLGAQIDPKRDRVEVDGTQIQLDPDLVYIALHKPLGVLTTARDSRGRPTVVELVPQQPRVFPVGRLDLDTAGLLLLTNDGDFANRVSHPRYGVAKTYAAEISGTVKPAQVRALKTGVPLDDGDARAEAVRVRARTHGRTLLELTVAEGRNRLVRRMLDALGLELVSLVRTSIGPIRLGRLKPGGWRVLRSDEVLEVLRITTP